MERYRFDPAAYVRDKLGWSPWSGSDDAPGQQQVIDVYVLALRQLHERDAYEQGQLAAHELQHWQPGQPIQNRIRIEAGHTVGKTKLASGLVNHFFDCFVPSIIYTYAPTFEQVHDLLWKEIKADRRDKGLPGRILDLALDRGDDHFAKGKATNNAGGKGTERAQGQHGKYLMFVLDEAEGVADFVYGAVDSMTSGGIAIVLMLANPRTRTSQFHKAAALSTVKSFRISCLHHPNVVDGREVVPGAVRRQYVDDMLEKHCDIVHRHAPDEHTFTVPWRPNVIYRPNAEFLFRVLGIAPANIADNTFAPVGRYEAAKARTAPLAVGTFDLPYMARIGVDCARWGSDVGTIYARHGGTVWRHAQLAKLDTTEYVQAVKNACKLLIMRGVTNIHVRVDGTGGWGAGVVDGLRKDAELRRVVRVFLVFEVSFNATPHDPKAYADLVTEMYAHTGEALKNIALTTVPDALEQDLCERTYTWVKERGVDVKKLEPKDDFRERVGRSPDDGDGCVLAAAPDYCFKMATGSRQSSYLQDEN